MDFKNQKTQRLEHADLSRKGSVDEPIVELVNFINLLPNYFTTSSCSGRIILFESASVDENPVSTLGKPGKKGCKWLFVSHSAVNNTEIKESLDKVSDTDGNAVFKFEPMVMHVQCQTTQDAQMMHQAAVAAGFRNSGISLGGKGKIIMGVRSTHSLEAPLTKDGVMLVTPEYYQFLVECANEKMEENFTRIKRFFENMKLLSKSVPSSEEGKSTAKVKKMNSDYIQSHTGDETTHRPKDKPGSEDVVNVIPADGKEDELCLFMFENK